MSDQRDGRTIDEIELRICQIWAEVLRVDHVNPGDNFLEIGGSSLQGLRLVSRIKAEFDVPLPADLFLFLPTASAMSAHVEQALHDPQMSG